jgi:hypothetical protein
MQVKSSGLIMSNIYVTALVFFIFGGAVGFLIGFLLGNLYGVHNFIVNNCTSYPFLLLDSKTHLACMRP